MQVDEELGRLVAERALKRDVSIAVAESLTGGALSAALARSPDAASWFRGAVVAYARRVKHEVLEVPEGPVVCASAAEAMARGARGILGADVAVALTGVGGPKRQDGRPPGTVFLALAADGVLEVHEAHLSGDPSEVCRTAVDHALTMLAEYLATD